MSIRRYIASADTTIYNAFEPNLIYRMTGSNTGNADSLEVFHIFAQADTGSHEYARTLITFPIDTISSDRTNKYIANSGSVEFHLRLYNAVHPFTVPNKITLGFYPLSRSWDEGQGLDMDEGTDNGIANWNQASTGSTGLTTWTTTGGDFYSSTYVPGSTLPFYTYYLEKGYANVDLDITSLVEEWIAGTKSNYGLLIKLIANQESALSSSYTKKFYSRSSEYFFYRPCIEARIDDSKRDNRGNFYASSSLVSTENSNTLYLYNYARGQLRNIPGSGTGAIYVKMYTDSISGSCLTTTAITGGYYSTGIYTASFALDTTSSYVYDRWFNSGLSTCYFTGSRITVHSLNGNSYNPNPKYTISMPNLRDSYSTEEEIRLDVYTKQKNWSPNKYVVMQNDPEIQYIEDMYYSVRRVTDDLQVIEFGTGSMNNTRLSYDVSGSYFNFPFSLLESGYAYKFQYCYKKDSLNFEKFKEEFKFRVD